MQRNEKKQKIEREHTWGNWGCFTQYSLPDLNWAPTHQVNQPTLSASPPPDIELLPSPRLEQRSQKNLPPRLGSDPAPCIIITYLNRSSNPCKQELHTPRSIRHPRPTGTEFKLVTGPIFFHQQQPQPPQSQPQQQPPPQQQQQQQSAQNTFEI